MRNRDFRPTLDGALEPRIVPTGHKAVVLTTNAYYNAATALDDAAERYLKAGIAHRPTQDDLAALVKQMSQATKGIPYGHKVLLPALIQTFNNYAGAGLTQGIRGAFGNLLTRYVQNATEGGTIRYLQSNVTHPTDNDIATQGHVPRSSRK